MSTICRAIPLGVVLLIAACVEKPIAPFSLSDVQLTVVSGDGQSGSAGQELPQPLVVRVTGSNGKGIRGQIVNFRVTAGGGRMFAGSSLTDVSGVAQDYWTLGSPGSQQVEVVAVDPTTGAKQNFGTFNATALAPASLVISPTSTSFGTWPVGGTSGSTVFTVQNTGDEASGSVTSSLGGLNQADFAISGTSCGGSLAGGATCTVSVRFVPTASGGRNATLNVSASPGGSASASLSGSGSLPPALQFAPSTFNFGSIVVFGNSATQVFTLTNTGGAPASSIALAIGGTNPADFAIVGTNCTGITLNPAQTCTAGVVFVPKAGDIRSALLTATATGGITASATLSGIGISPAALAIAPTSFNFGSIDVGSTSSLQAFTVTNTGGTVSSALAIGVTGTNAADFPLGANNCSGISLAPAQSCTVQVRFAPLSAGGRSASLGASSVGTNAASAALSGTGVAVTQLAISPPSYNFPTIVVGATPGTMQFTVTNTGSSASGALQTSLTGTNATEFQLGSDSCNSNALNAGATCTVIVAFVPINAGTKSASLTVTASPGGTASSLLTGSALPPASITVTPTSLVFGSQLVRTSSAPQAITVTNVGSQSEGILFSVQGAAPQDFFVTNSCTTIAPGASCTMSVTFSPTAVGVRTATLHVITSQGYAVPVSLSGTGL